MFGLVAKVLIIALGLTLVGGALGFALHATVSPGNSENSVPQNITPEDRIISNTSATPTSSAPIAPSKEDKSPNAIPPKTTGSTSTPKTSSSTPLVSTSTITSASSSDPGLTVSGGGGVATPSTIEQQCQDANLTEDDFAALQSGGQISTTTQAAIQACIQAGGPTPVDTTGN